MLELQQGKCGLGIRDIFIMRLKTGIHSLGRLWNLHNSRVLRTGCTNLLCNSSVSSSVGIKKRGGIR